MAGRVMFKLYLLAVMIFTFAAVSGAKPLQGRAVDDQADINALFSCMLELVRFSPAPEQAILLDAVFSVQKEGQKTACGSVSILRGHGRRFKLSANMDKVPGVPVEQLNLGFSEYPWVISGKGTLYKGDINPVKPGVDAYFSNQVKMFWQMLAGVLFMASNGMLEPLKQWCSISVEHDDEGKRHIHIAVENTDIRIFMRDDRPVPQRISFVNRKLSGEVLFHHWLTGSPIEAEAFNPSEQSGVRIVNVEQEKLNRMIAALVNFGVKRSIGKP